MVLNIRLQDGGIFIFLSSTHSGIEPHLSKSHITMGYCAPIARPSALDSHRKMQRRCYHLNSFAYVYMFIYVQLSFSCKSADPLHSISDPVALLFDVLSLCFFHLLFISHLVYSRHRFYPYVIGLERVLSQGLTLF